MSDNKLIETPLTKKEYVELEILKSILENPNCNVYYNGHIKAAVRQAKDYAEVFLEDD
mgnify:CR=1 FL=1